MQRTLLVIFLYILINFGFSQDSISYIQQAERLLADHQYASAQKVLESALPTLGLQPTLVCPMIEIVVKHHFMQQDYEVFYLRDSTAEGKNTPDGRGQNIKTVAFHHPNRLLKKVIERSPQFAWAYKLMGDYYNLQLSETGNLDLIPTSTYLELREKVFTNYHRAAQLGYSDAEVNRWLGQYYSEANQPKVAKQYYQMNVNNNLEDPPTYFYLAEIYYSEKQYSQGYNYAVKALQNYKSLNLDLRYKSTRLAALSLFQLGERARFMDYIVECIQLFPDRQAAYLDLLEYYEVTDDSGHIRKTIKQMLLNNPYQETGYEYLENFCVEHLDYQFGEKLFEEMMVKFEHSDEAMANIYHYRGNLLFHQGLTDEAKKLWDISRNYFRRFLPEDSPQLHRVGDISRESSRK